ncbi:MAG: polyphosphate:AMP phosphotransferase [Haliea sp.]|uniref:polyphosphate:AMP phosphotransferase n=1 Tax=Haliea sp. TaxID=1932666 RepID=UPI0032F01F2F
MFEALETGKFLSPDEYKARELELRQKLLAAQFDQAERDYPVIILVAGLPGAGKGTLVHRLNEWMDPRRIETSAIWMHSDEEEERPFFWRFWRKLPPKGKTGIFLGSWYTRPLHDATEGKLGMRDLQVQLEEINAFERMLYDDGALLIKLWLHVTRETQRHQLDEEAPRLQQNPRVGAYAGHWWDMYPRALTTAEQILLGSDTGHTPWHLIEADDRLYREITGGEIILRALQERANRSAKPASAPANYRASAPGRDQPTVLAGVPADLTLDKDEYRIQLHRQQRHLQDLAWLAHRRRRSLVAVFEGWDAAGKGSAIRRVTAAIDPRLYQVVQYAAPTDEERAHHYLWRFWRKLERDGRATLFDRSWYGRVLVERVEQLTPMDAWRRAYHEINQFEGQLVAHGCVLVKFWLHITPEEQLRRFEDRQKKPHKQYKITEDDWRNRQRWNDYEIAVEDMVAHTSTGFAPWTLVAGNDKRYARIQILRTLCNALNTAMGGEYPAPEPAAIMSDRFQPTAPNS